jgi:phthiocerol/phenolphthiocerol synthesis type-I polyketide synthase C
MSFGAAATIPSAFFTVYYALTHLAHLEAGEKILIHGAAGGVGIAAIQLAQSIGAEVYATAGSNEKRDFLRLMGVKHIFDSRSLDFAGQILSITDGLGVDVVLNSLAGEAINRNFSVLKPFGRFLELGKRDFYENTKIGLRPFRNNISYFGIDADQLMKERPDLTGKLFAKVMDLFSQGQLHPLPFHTFDAGDVVSAFRYMQQARQIGKIVVTYKNGIIQSHKSESPNKDQLILDTNGCYLITGGLSGFGLRTAEWLATKGARHLVLVSRSGASTEEAKAAVAHLEEKGVHVLTAACDVTDQAALQVLFDQIKLGLPPLKGIVHAAMVIDDGLGQNMTAAQIEKVLAPKILGAQYLHQLTQGMSLDFFVLFSSATTLFGNPGQGNYVAANTWLEAFANNRLRAGLPATCVRWGAIDDVGFLARNEKIKDALQTRMGGAAIKSVDALHALESMLINKRSGLGVLELEWKALARFLPSATSPKFKELARQAGESTLDDDHSDDIQKLIQELSHEELLNNFSMTLRNEVSEILRIAPEKIDINQSLYDLGMDSLMGVELMVALESRFGVRLSVMALSESPSIIKLTERIILQLTENIASDDTPIAAEDQTLAQVQQVALQHGSTAKMEEITFLAENIHSADSSSNRKLIH